MQHSGFDSVPAGSDPAAKEGKNVCQTRSGLSDTLRPAEPPAKNKVPAGSRVDPAGTFILLFPENSADRPGSNDAAIGITALRTFIFAGDHRQREFIFRDDPFQSGEIIFTDLFIRINIE